MNEESDIKNKTKNVKIANKSKISIGTLLLFVVGVYLLVDYNQSNDVFGIISLLIGVLFYGNEW